ncbi:hypothetical protein [Corallococcus silvisoli]|uniref:hypothetical protein n=1 Tax=Corallococcus silvisoli TaxID=2697031 RepID=UPI001377E17D|nr:hypothetical protein [Corallococcus silvisoli]NBD13683.1 hypothetical protein [Corallococcus silvisoli]
MIVERILKGAKPTEIFHEMLARTPELTNVELGRAFTDCFEDVDWLAKTLIWKWNRSGTRSGIADERLDALLIELLRAAGYAVPDMP